MKLGGSRSCNSLDPTYATGWLPFGEIFQRLRNLTGDSQLGMDQDGDFRISIAGAQEKMALLYRKGKWWEPRGATPTNTILKNPIATLFKGTTEDAIDFTASVDNEWICLKLAEQFNIDVAKASIVEFEDQRVLSVERFDRQWKDDLLIRIPQEDFCQATGTSSMLKCKKKGGPSIKMMMNILSSSANAAADRKMFFKTLIFNDLIYNTDSHAKNFSLFNLRVGYALTPMYDLLSAHFLKSMHQVRYENLKSSLKVNGKEKFIEITLTDWQAEATKCGLAKNIFEDIINKIQLSVKKMSIGENQRPQSLDLNQLEQIFDGMQNRARLLLI